MRRQFRARQVLCSRSSGSLIQCSSRFLQSASIKRSPKSPRTLIQFPSSCSPGSSRISSAILSKHTQFPNCSASLIFLERFLRGLPLFLPVSPEGFSDTPRVFLPTPPENVHGSPTVFLPVPPQRFLILLECSSQFPTSTSLVLLQCSSQFPLVFLECFSQFSSESECSSGSFGLNLPVRQESSPSYPRALLPAPRTLLQFPQDAP
jgi:hypothetical protein